MNNVVKDFVEGVQDGSATISGVDMDVVQEIAQSLSETDAMSVGWRPVEFEPWEGQDYDKGFYKVRLPDGRETWAYPNAGAMNLFTEDGTHSTGEMIWPGGCEARWADEDYHELSQTWQFKRKAPRVVQFRRDPYCRAYRQSGANAPLVRSEKIGRNEPCPCGSGSKYKRCCLRKGEA